MKGAYTNLVLPHLLGKYRLDRPRRGVRHRAGRRARSGARAPTTRSSPPAPTGRWPTPRPRSSTSSGSGCHQLLGMRVAPHAAISTSVDLVRSEVGPGPSGFANAVLRKVSAHDLDDLAAPGSTPTGRPGFSHPQLDRRRAGRGAGSATDEIDALLAADNEPPAVTLVARPGRSHRRRAAGRADALLAVRRRVRGRRPRRGAGRRRGSRRRAGRGLAAGRPRPGARRRSRAPTSAGSTCAPAPAARRPCSPPWRPRAAPGSSPTSSSRTAPTWYAVRSPAPSGRRGGDRRGRHRAAVAGRLVRPGARRRARAPGSAPSDGGPRRAGGAARRTCATWSRSSARCSTAALDLVRPGGVVLYATCSPVLAETRDVLGSVLVGRDDVKLGDATSLLTARRRTPRRRTGLRRAARRHRPALAAPPPHRRDVPGPAPSSLSRM